MSKAAKPVTVPDYLQKVLDEYDSKGGDFREFELSGALDEAAKASRPLSDEHRRGYVAEAWAFLFDHSRPGETSTWDTHFGPVMTVELKDHNVLYKPDLRQVDAGIIQYWERRRDNVRHPAMRARYADLLWDLQKHITGERASVDDARIAIDAYIEAVRRVCPEYTIDNIHRLMRALDLAISINDAGRVEAVRDAMFTLYDKVIDPSKGGSWPWLFDMLHDNTKVPLTEEQRRHMIDSLEDILKLCTNPEEKESFNPWSAESAAQRLALHYTRQNQPDNVRRVILAFGEAYIHISRIAMGIVSIGWLQKVHDAYRQHGLYAEAAQVLRLYKEKGKEAEGQMGHVQVTMQIDQAKLNAAVAELVAKGLEGALSSCALTFVPTRSEALELIRQVEDAAPLMSHFGIKILSEQQIIAEIGSTREDLDGRIVRQISENIDLSRVFLGAALNGIIGHFRPSADVLTSHLSHGALCDPVRKPLIRDGLQAYLAGDHVKAIHILVPQIEHCMRALLWQLGQPTSKPVRGVSGIMQEKSLTDVLEREPAITAFFKHFGIEDWHLYLRVYLTDRRGHNLRNRLAHGLIGPSEFSQQLSDRVLHILLLLSMIGKKTESNEGEGTAGPNEVQT